MIILLITLDILDFIMTFPIDQINWPMEHLSIHFGSVQIMTTLSDIDSRTNESCTDFKPVWFFHLFFVWDVIYAWWCLYT